MSSQTKRLKPISLDKATAEYIFNEITKLGIDHWKLFEDKADYDKGKNMAYRECASILTTILNNKLLTSV
jgi:hypothetical protein